MVVVGAGIVGAASAYFLTRRGFRVRLLDAAAPSAAASGAADGAVSVASKRPGPMMATALAGIELYRQLTREGLFSGLFKMRPTIMVAENDLESDALSRHGEALAGEGMAIRRIEGSALQRELPTVSAGVRLAIEVRDEGHAIGYEIVRRLIAASGIAVERKMPVHALVEDSAGHSIAAVDTPQGRIQADHFVIAAGGGSTALLGLSGLTTPRKGQLVVTERRSSLAATLPGSLMSCRYLLSKDAIPTHEMQMGRRFGLVIDPLRTGQFLIGGTREESDDISNDLAAVRQMLASAVKLLPSLADLRAIRAFAGVRTATKDGLPIVGRTARFSNVIVATGFEGDGICLGPLIGRSVSELISGDRVQVDLQPFLPSRFESRSMIA